MAIWDNLGPIGGKKGKDSKAVQIPIASGDEKVTPKEELTVIQPAQPKESETIVSKNLVQTDAQPEETIQDAQTENKVEDKSKSVVPEPRKIAKVCKAGTEHTRCNVNNHDFAFSFMNLKAVTDGCGSGKHSEVGTRLFGQLFAGEVRKFMKFVENGERMKLVKYVRPERIQALAEQLEKKEIPEEAFLGIVNSVFEKMLNLCDESSFIFENYCFTILVCFEYENEYVVYSCGDGYIIKEDSEGISFEELDDGEYPAYYVYNWVNPADLKEYKAGVEFKVSRFSKDKYVNVGVASDGLRFFSDLYEPEQFKLLENLSEGRSAQIDMLINRNNRKYATFKDDISICF